MTTIKDDTNDHAWHIFFDWTDDSTKKKGATIRSFYHFRFFISFQTKMGKDSWLMTPAPSFPGQSMRA
jgi:hypothetical protein